MLDKQRPRVPHSLEFYSFANYLAYVLYAPLYIAGPIMTFNDFTWQVKLSCVLTSRVCVDKIRCSCVDRCLSVRGPT